MSEHAAKQIKQEQDCGVALSLPLYCSLCGVPCALPRVGAAPDSGLAPVSTPSTATASAADTPPATWLHHWVALQTSAGVVEPVIAPSSGAAAARSVPVATPRFTVTVHAACLSRVERAIQAPACAAGSGSEGRTGARTASSAHDRELAVCRGWSLPRWTGWAPWARDEDRAGYWTGTRGQRERWRGTGVHWVDADLIDPDVLPPPTPRAVHAVDRPTQTSRLLELPDTVLVQILEHLLPALPALPSLPALAAAFGGPQADPSRAPRAPVPVELDLSDFTAMRQTCAQLRAAPLPSATWARLARASAASYAHALVRRWTACPLGRARAGPLAAALDADFQAEIHDALVWCRRGSASGADQIDVDDRPGAARAVPAPDPDVDAQDVYTWYTYSPAWRSRRRVWTCAVHGTATARDADWW
ncbi:hypothetical protein Q5752_001086 [Cryptotrichosporon argae]